MKAKQGWAWLVLEWEKGREGRGEKKERVGKRRRERGPERKKYVTSVTQKIIRI